MSGRTNTTAMLRSRTAWLIGGTVAIALVLIGVWIFAGFTWGNANDIEDECRSKINNLDKTLEKEVDKLQEQIDKINKKIKNLEDQINGTSSGNCSACTNLFVTQTVFNETISLIEEEISLIGNGSCTNCVNNTYFNSIIADINNDIITLEGDVTTIEGDIVVLQDGQAAVVEIQSGNNFAMAEGFVGGSSTGGVIDPFFVMESDLICTSSGVDGNLDATFQVQNKFFMFENVQHTGTCTNNSQPLLIAETDKSIRFCPCTDGWYDVAINVQNLYVIRQGPEDTSVPEVADRGGAISFGFLYNSSTGDGFENQRFNEGAWPLSPVYTHVWGVDDTSATLPPYTPPQSGCPTVAYAGQPFLPISFSASRPVYFKVDIPGEPPGACYDFVIQIADFFLPPEYNNFCTGTPPDASVFYTFFEFCGSENYDEAAKPQLFGALAIQKLAWSNNPPDTYTKDLDYY